MRNIYGCMAHHGDRSGPPLKPGSRGERWRHRNRRKGWRSFRWPN